MNCPDCNTEIDYEGLCSSCKRRKAILKDKYQPLKDLPIEQREKLLTQRKYSIKYNQKHKKEKQTASVLGKDLNKVFKKVNMEEINSEVLKNISSAFEKSDLDQDILIKNDYSELETILKAIETINYNTISEEDYELKREKIRKKVDILDKYIIDILHNLESIPIDDTENQIIEVKKLAQLRKIRREFKNRYELLKYIHSFTKLLQDEKGYNFSKICKEGEMFLNSIKYKIYNKIVESPTTKKANMKLLNLRNYNVTCDIVSAKTNRKIIKFSKVIEATTKEDAGERAKALIKEEYGEDSVWSKLKVNY